MMDKHIALVLSPYYFSTRDVGIGYQKALRKLGYPVVTIDYAVIWNAWARIADIAIPDGDENTKKKWIVERASFDVLRKTIEYAPDLTIVIDGTQLHNMFWEWTTKMNVTTAVVSTDCPYHDKSVGYIAQYADYTFANDLVTSEKLGIGYLPMAYSKYVHHPANVPNHYQCDVVFAGSGYRERIDLLEQVDWSGIDLRLMGYWPVEGGPLAPYASMRAGVSNDEVAMWYNGAKLVLNLDRVSIDFPGTRRIPGRRSVGPRVYEAAACGSAIVSQNVVREIDELLGTGYICFSGPGDLRETLLYWLQDERAELREKVGLRAKERIQGHSYEDRAIRLMETVDLPGESGG